MNSTTACPLDCYDACGIDFSSGKIKAVKSGYTQGFLCPHLNHFTSHEIITKPRYKGEEISKERVVKILHEMFESSLKSDILLYRGSGNFALMQEVSDYFFAQMGATLTDGTLCDGAGEAGIIEGRGSNKNMPYSEIAKSDVVVFWGRNPHVTSSHLLPLIKGKEIIVIDPIETQIAKMADLFLQIRPHSDSYLAMLLVRFLHINESCDEEFIEKYASEFEDYYELTQNVRIKAVLEEIDVTLGDIGRFIEMVEGKKVAIVCGVGVQKYRDGADVIRSIDAIAVALGLFGKEGCGVAYLGASRAGIENPFEAQAKRVSKVDTPFEEYETVFVQGANPAAQMPDSKRVRNSLQKVKNLIYFGLYENETSALADLVIPAKTFLQKEDIRTSYGHHGMFMMPKVQDGEDGFSEYELISKLCKLYNIELKEEKEYIEHFKSYGVQKIDGCFEVEERENIPYQDGFDTDDGEFVFLEEYEQIAPLQEGSYYLITPKSATSLNSQFYRQKYLYMNSRCGIEEGSVVEVASPNGSVELELKYHDGVRLDSVLIYSGTPGVNNLTTSLHSYEGKCAIYQENSVTITLKKEK